MTDPQARAPRMSRRGGWWGIGFVAAVVVQAAMVSLPTAASSGERIRVFYAVHAQLIVAQQILGILALIPLVGFVVALRRRLGGRQWLLAGAALVVAEVSTNVLPLTLVISNPSAQTAHGLTVVEDLADVALSASIALFALVVALKSGWLLRALGLVVAGLTLARAAASLLAPTILDMVAPIAFLAFVLAVSLHMLFTPPGQRAV